VQPFLQLGRPVYTARPDEKLKLARLVGRQMQTRRFVPLMQQRGWEQGRGGPAGYRKRFPRFGLTALIEAVRMVMLDGAGVGAVASQIGIMVAWGLISFVVALRMFRLQ
jgi:hypothetical protein